MIYTFKSPAKKSREKLKKNFVESKDSRTFTTLIQSHVLNNFITQNTPRCPDAVLPMRLDKPSANGVFCFMPSFKFDYDEWKSQDALGITFALPPKKSGVYIIAKQITDTKKMQVTFKFLYVGSSSNIKNRLKGHPIYSRIKSDGFGRVITFFRETIKYIAFEKKVIRSLKPFYNIQHNNNG